MSTVSWSATHHDSECNDEENITAKGPALCMISICYRKDRIGLAIVDRDEPLMLKLMEEQPELPGCPTVESTIFDLEPNLVIIPGRGEHEFAEDIKELIKKYKKEKPGAVIELLSGLSTEYKPTTFLAIFSLDEAKKLENQTTIAAASALLNISRKKNEETELPIEIEWFNMSHYMAIDYDSLLALQIIHDEAHPNMHINDKRGGLCLLNLINKCKSAPGKRLLKTWITRPLKNKDLIEDRQAEIETILTKIVSKGLLPELQRSIRGMPRIEMVLNRLFQPSSRVFSDLHKFIKSAIDLCRLTRTVELEGMSDIDSELLQNLSTLINGIIDLKQSNIQDKIVIRPKVNPDLDNLRQIYHSLPTFLTETVHQIAENIRNPIITTVNVVYFPQLGFLVTVALNDQLMTEEVNENGFELQFVTEKVAYFKDPMTRKLDEEIGDVYADMVDIEIEIIRVLIEKIMPHKRALIGYGRRFAEFDCLTSLAEFASENNLVKPIITNEKLLYIRNGRHLLQEKVCDNVVPNDCNFDERKVIILTGPNSSGKSIYIKQVALIVMMAQIGSFVPAESASIGIFDRVFTRIQTRESIISGMSAFQTDLLQIKKAIDGSTGSSMILIDEFGKGTNPNDGIAVFSSTIKHFCEMEDCPRVIAITHFHEIYQCELLAPELPIKWCTMDIIEGSEVTFLYKLISGKATSSLGIRCAKMAGISGNILARAEALVELYQAKVSPINIRYAQLDPNIERSATNLILAVLAEVPQLENIKYLAREFRGE